jgi:hypothetical protein
VSFDGFGIGILFVPIVALAMPWSNAHRLLEELVPALALRVRGILNLDALRSGVIATVPMFRNDAFEILFAN